MQNRHLLKNSGATRKLQYDESFRYIEGIILKLSTGPVQAYDSLTYDVFGRIIVSTDSSYHQRIAGIMVDTIAAIYLQKKRGRAEDFKSKIILKLSHLIGLLC